MNSSYCNRLLQNTDTGLRFCDILLYKKNIRGEHLKYTSNSEYVRNTINGVYNDKSITTLDDFFSYTQDLGSIEQAASNAMYGINQTKRMGVIPYSKETQGFVFFTRPTLNLSEPNLKKKREFHSLLTTDRTSVHRYVRCMLDPSLKNHAAITTSSPLVDNELVFIPLLTNTITKLSGWPDVVAPTFTSKSGIRKEQWCIVDGTTEVNEAFDMDATFRNIIDEPHVLLFRTWVNYQANVFDGQMRPYAGVETRNELDATTRIYRLVLDKNERFVTKIACTIASFPINDPTGKSFDYDREKQYMDQNKEINIRFRCMGAVYNDEIIIKWFNTAAGYANNDLNKIVASGFQNTPSHGYEAIPRELLGKFKYRGYPLINTDTFELQWWINKQSKEYRDVINGFNLRSQPSDLSPK